MKRLTRLSEALMDYRRIILAALLAWHTRLMLGFAIWITPIGDEMAKYPAVFRPVTAPGTNVPLMLAGSLLAMLVLAYVFARGYKGGNGALEGLRFGALMAAFAVAFVSVSLYVQLNIGLRLAVMGAAQLMIELVIVGVVIGVASQPSRRAQKSPVAGSSMPQAV